jgi:carboxylesterase type B
MTSARNEYSAWRPFVGGRGITDARASRWGREEAKLVRRSCFYRFAYVPEALREKVSGAIHGSEILFVSDSVAASLKERASGADVPWVKPCA